MLVKIVRCDVVYRTVDFGVPSFFFRRLYCTIPTYELRTYLPKSTIFFPARTDLAVKLLSGANRLSRKKEKRKIKLSKKMAADG
jgi:hypothetical protein